MLNYLLLPVQRAAFVSFLTLYFPNVVLRPAGWGLHALRVRHSDPDARAQISRVTLDPPCEVEDIPAVDAIVLSVCSPFR